MDPPPPKQVKFCGPWTNGVITSLSHHEWFDTKRAENAIFADYMDALDYLVNADNPTLGRRQSIAAHRLSLENDPRSLERRDTSA